MNKVANRLMSVLMVVGSIIAVATYAQDHITLLNPPAVLPDKMISSVGKMTPPELDYSSRSLSKPQTFRPNYSGRQPVAYSEKKAMVIHSYQLQDPRARPHFK